MKLVKIQKLVVDVKMAGKENENEPPHFGIILVTFWLCLDIHN